MKSISDWANRHQALFNSGVAVLCVIGGFFLNHLFNGPTFFPTTVVLTDAEDRPVERDDLSNEAQACDAAVRSMLLAFASEADQDGPDGPGFPERASAAVESPYAIIPEECRRQIDEGFVITANGVSAELKSARQTGNKIAISFVLKNNTNGTRRFAISGSKSAEVKVSSGSVRSISVSGIADCTLSCAYYDFNDATQIDSGRSVLVHIEALLSGDERPSTATVIFPVVRWWSGDTSKREVVLAFNDIPIEHVAEAVDAEAKIGLEAAK
jgi:hypothetical protein